MESAQSASFLLVTQYDGGAFSGWQRQPDARTVQGEMEQALAGLTGEPATVVAAGRTDAGVHARGQGVGVRIAPRWTAETIRRAMNARLPGDVWVADAHAMRPEFHPRFSAERRRYAYFVGTTEDSLSPFRRRTEWPLARALDVEVLNAEAAALPGIHTFRAFAVQGTAPADDDHRCEIFAARWRERESGVVFDIEANRFLHHMVRFLVGTMVAVGTGRRAPGSVAELLESPSNQQTAAPAPPQGLFLERVSYPETLYLSST